MKGICQDTTPILGIFPGYRKKLPVFHNRIIDLHWVLKQISLKYIWRHL